MVNLTHIFMILHLWSRISISAELFPKLEVVELVDNVAAREVSPLFSTRPMETGPVKIPWISLPGLQLMPVCFNDSPAHLENIVRLSHVLCRHSGFMMVIKWFPVTWEGTRSNRTGLSPVEYCRGDEQSLAHCQWQQPIVESCHSLLALECGDCSNTYNLGENSQVNLTSPGFPFYIPLVNCEWNITVKPNHDLVLRFHQFDLPNPIYDEVIDGFSCRSGSLDILSFREDINKITLDGRFCGRHNPGNLTILSSRVLIRFNSGNYKEDAISKRGFFAECLIVPSNLVSSNIQITRWVLVGFAILLALAVVIFLWVCKGKFRSLRHYCCCPSGRTQMTSNHVNTEQPLPLNSCRRSSPIGIPLTVPRAPVTSNRRRHSDVKSSIHSCDVMHWQQTKRLEKWRSARSGVDNVKAMEVSVLTKADETHIYEDIDVDLHNNNEKKSRASGSEGVTPAARGSVAASAGTGRHPLVPPPSTTRRFSLSVSRSRLYGDTARASAYRPLNRSPPLGRSSLATSPSLPGVLLHSQRRSRLLSNGSVLCPPSYFQAAGVGASSESAGSDSSASAIYINPEASSGDEEQ